MYSSSGACEAPCGTRTERCAQMRGQRTACARLDVFVMAHARSLAAGTSFTARFGPLVMRNAVPPRPSIGLPPPCMQEGTLKPMHVSLHGFVCSAAMMLSDKILTTTLGIADLLLDAQLRRCLCRNQLAPLQRNAHKQEAAQRWSLDNRESTSNMLTCVLAGTRLNMLSACQPEQAAYAGVLAAPSSRLRLLMPSSSGAAYCPPTVLLLIWNRFTPTLQAALRIAGTGRPSHFTSLGTSALISPAVVPEVPAYSLGCGYISLHLKWTSSQPRVANDENGSCTLGVTLLCICLPIQRANGGHSAAHQSPYWSIPTLGDVARQPPFRLEGLGLLHASSPGRTFEMSSGLSPIVGTATTCA